MSRCARAHHGTCYESMRWPSAASWYIAGHRPHHRSRGTACRASYHLCPDHHVMPRPPGHSTLCPYPRARHGMPRPQGTTYRAPTTRCVTGTVPRSPQTTRRRPARSARDVVPPSIRAVAHALARRALPAPPSLPAVLAQVASPVGSRRIDLRHGIFVVCPGLQIACARPTA